MPFVQQAPLASDALCCLPPARRMPTASEVFDGLTSEKKARVFLSFFGWLPSLEGGKPALEPNDAGKAICRAFLEEMKREMPQGAEEKASLATPPPSILHRAQLARILRKHAVEGAPDSLVYGLFPLLAPPQRTAAQALIDWVAANEEVHTLSARRGILIWCFQCHACSSALHRCIYDPSSDALNVI